MTTTDEGQTPDASPNRSKATAWLKWGILGLIAVVVVVFGGILVYVNFIKDSPDAFDEGDLDAALSIDDEPTDTEPDSDTSSNVDEEDAPDPSTDDTDEADDTEPANDGGSADAPASTAGGAWTVTDESEFGYRVTEVLFGVDTAGVGRSNQITGDLTIEGTQVATAAFEVDVASITSDESRRDGQFRGRIMSTDEFPTATFVLTEPIELGAEPSEGMEITTDATGDLTLRGVTNQVVFDVTAKLENGKIGVLGSIPVVFEDYSIANPSFGGVQTEDDGLVEFVLVFEPAT